MKPILFALSLAIFAPASIAHAQRRIDMSFGGQMVSAVEELKEKIKVDPDIEGRKLRLGKFSGPNLPDSNFDIEFERKFAELMTGLLDEESSLVVNGVYDFLPGQLRENKDLQVIQFVIKVIDRSRRTLQAVTREINRSADIVKITGTTVALPDTTKVEDRNEAAFEALIEPKFGIRDTYGVTAEGSKKHAVAILRKTGGKGKPAPIVPRNVNGFAFVDLNVTDTFVIVLINHDTRCDASALVTIDGLDVTNTFCQDDVKYEGYTVPRATGSRPGKHVLPGWLKTAKTNTDNVFEFTVNELGKGAATQLKCRHKQGIIHVEFYEAVPPAEELPSRRFGEVGKGRAMDVSYQVQQMKRRESPIASVSIRYSNPGRKR